MSYNYAGLTLPETGELITATSVSNNFELVLSRAASASAPSSPVTGQFWFNTSTSAISVWDGSVWIPLSTTPIPSQTGNNGKFLQTNGTTLSWSSSVSGTGNLLILGAASGTFTVPTGITQLLVYAFGGGAGGGYSTAGGAGGCGAILLPVTPGQAIPYTVGAGGGGNGDFEGNSNGGTTTFGNPVTSPYIVATGGTAVGGQGTCSFGTAYGAIKFQSQAALVSVMRGYDGATSPIAGGGGGAGIGGGGAGYQSLGGAARGPGTGGQAGGIAGLNYGGPGGGVPTGVIRTAGSFIVLKQYKIVTVGTTDFTAIGANSNTVGEVFFATAAGSGTGTAEEYNGGRGGQGGVGRGGGGGGGALIIVY